MRPAGPLLLLAAVLLPHPARAYSVLTHEALVDVAWDASIQPALRALSP